MSTTQDTNQQSDHSKDPNPEMTLELYELFQVPRDERDEEWVKDFFEVVPTASLRGFDPQIQRGPDGFPYLVLGLPESGEDFDAYSIEHSLDYCLKIGCGIVLFKDPKDMKQPEWVFPFGSLWSYAKYGNFIGDPNDERPEPEAPPPEAQERQVQVGYPNDEYIPSFARVAITRFLKDTIGLEKPRVALVIDPLLKPTRSLMFADLHPDRFEKEEHFAVLMNGLRWFLPATRGLMVSVPEIAEHAAPL